MQDHNEPLTPEITSEKASHPIEGGVQKTTVVPQMGGGGPIVYGSIEHRTGAKERLIRRLLSCLMESGALQSNQRRVTLKKDGLGRPFLSWPGTSAPAISFSHANGRTWAGLGWAAGIGMDVAYLEEFHAPYPFDKVFGQREFDQARELCGVGVQDRAALLWSVKEAAVKAWGCGFNFLNPLDVEVQAISRLSGGFLFEVNADSGLRAWTRREDQAWVTVALFAPLRKTDLTFG